MTIAQGSVLPNIQAAKGLLFLSPLVQQINCADMLSTFLYLSIKLYFLMITVFITAARAALGRLLGMEHMISTVVI